MKALIAVIAHFEFRGLSGGRATCERYVKMVWMTLFDQVSPGSRNVINARRERFTPLARGAGGFVVFASLLLLAQPLGVVAPIEQLGDRHTPLLHRVTPPQRHSLMHSHHARIEETQMMGSEPPPDHSTW